MPLPHKNISDMFGGRINRPNYDPNKRGLVTGPGGYWGPHGDQGFGGEPGSHGATAPGEHMGGVGDLGGQASGALSVDPEPEKAETIKERFDRLRKEFYTPMKPEDRAFIEDQTTVKSEDGTPVKTGTYTDYKNENIDTSHLTPGTLKWGGTHEFGAEHDKYMKDFYGPESEFYGMSYDYVDQYKLATDQIGSFADTMKSIAHDPYGRLRPSIQAEIEKNANAMRDALHAAISSDDDILGLNVIDKMTGVTQEDKAYSTIARALGIPIGDVENEFSPEQANEFAAQIQKQSNIGTILSKGWDTLSGTASSVNPLAQDTMTGALGSAAKLGVGYGTTEVVGYMKDMGLSNMAIANIFGQGFLTSKVGDIVASMFGVTAHDTQMMENWGINMTVEQAEAMGILGEPTLLGEPTIDINAALEKGVPFSGETHFMSDTQFDTFRPHLNPITMQQQIADQRWGSAQRDADRTATRGGGPNDEVAESTLMESIMNQEDAGGEHVSDQSNWSDFMKGKYAQMKRNEYNDEYIEAYFQQMGLLA